MFGCLRLSVFAQDTLSVTSPTVYAKTPTGKGKIFLTNRKSLKVESLDSLLDDVLYCTVKGKAVSVSTALLNEIRVVHPTKRSSGRGALTGGIVAGSFLGITAAVANSSSSFKVPGIGFVGAGIGFLGGALVGALIGASMPNYISYQYQTLSLPGKVALSARILANPTAATAQ